MPEKSIAARLRRMPEAFVSDASITRAVFMMFLIAEIHPFADGNGRTARIMMNAELVAAGEERIVIPPASRQR